jgi:hypothetical protein
MKCFWHFRTNNRFWYTTENRFTDKKSIWWYPVDSGSPIRRMDNGPVKDYRRKVRFTSSTSEQSTKTMCERTKKVAAMNASPSNTDRNDKDEAAAHDAGLYKEAWLIDCFQARFQYRVFELSCGVYIRVPSRKGAKQYLCSYLI